MAEKTEEPAAFSNTLQQLYLASVERGDIRTLEKVLKDKAQFDINATNANGNTAIQLAIESSSVEILKLLLKHDVDIGAALFHAIEAKFIKAIEMILDHPQGKDLINEYAGNKSEEIHPDTTPIILAAHHNDYEIIKLLLSRGATPIEVTSGQTESHTIQRSVGTLNIYKALSSEAYMSAIELQDEENRDPFRRAFELCQELRRGSSKEYEFREQYVELAGKCEQYSADLLGQTRDSAELNTVLSHDSDKNAKAIGKEDRPMKVLYAVTREQRKFVAHPHCQQQLIQLWYHGLADWRDSGWVRNAIISMLIMLAFPVLCIGYLILPFGKFGRFMRIPYVKFLMHTSSYIWFLILLFLSTQNYGGGQHHEGHDDSTHYMEMEIERRKSQQRGAPPNPVEWLIIIWLIGMTCREIREVWNEGLSDYFCNPWNVMDMVQLALYWLIVALRLTAFVLVHRERVAHLSSTGKRSVSEGLLNDTMDALDGNDTRNFLEDLVNGAADDVVNRLGQMIDDIRSSPENGAAFANISMKLTELNHLVSSLVFPQTTTEPPEITFDSKFNAKFDDISYAKERKDWDQFDPTLLGDCIFAVANVVSVIRFLRVMVINEYVGPLQISVGKMMNDIMRFMLIFILVWLAFALGLTQVYWSYAASTVFDCVMENGQTYVECYNERYFPDIVVSMRTLFWSLYGLIDLESVEVQEQHRTTEFFGEMLFAGYQIVAVIILLNLLIALMGTTYDEIVQNSDTEWKFSRSDMWMDYFRKGSTEPAPFNVFPSTKSLISTCRRCYYCIRCREDVKAAAKLERRMKSMKNRNENYKQVCKRLILRYLSDAASSGDVGDGSYAAKGDLSTVRFEIYNAMQHLEKTFDQFKLELSLQLKDVSAAIDENKREEMRAIEDVKDQLEKNQREGDAKLRDMGQRLSEEHRRLLSKPKASIADLFGGSLFPEGEPGIKEVTFRRAARPPSAPSSPARTASDRGSWASDAEGTKPDESE